MSSLTNHTLFNMIQSQYPILIIITPLITSLLVLIVGRWLKQSAYYLSIIALITTTLESLRILWEVIQHGTLHYRMGNWRPPWGIEYVIDHLSAFLIVIITTIGLCVVVYSKESIEKELPEKIVPFYCILLLLITGLLGMVATGDMFNLYVFLEVSALTAYGLIGLGEKRAPLASFRYLMMGTIGASFYLLGVGYLYLITGSLNMADISTRLPELYESKVVLVAFAFLIIGISVKLAIFPLHSWLPDAYTHAPSAVSAFIAPTMTKVAAYMLVRIMFSVFGTKFAIETVPITTILAWLGIVAMIVGSIYAIKQTDLKRMLAYSSIAQIGYIVLGIGLANRLGLTGGLLHILNHAFMKGCLFLVAGAIILQVDGRNIYRFKDLYRQMPYTMTAFVIAAFSMIGIPPTSGFFSKLYLILGSIEANQWIFVAVILLSSLLNVVYFINVVRTVYFGPSEAEIQTNPDKVRSYSPETKEVPWSMRLPIITTAAAILLLGIFNGTIIDQVIKFIIPTGI